MERTASRNNGRWRVLAVGFFAQAVFAIGFTGITVSGVLFQEFHALSLCQLGFVLGALGLGVGVSELLWGMATDRLGDRTVLFFGLSGMGLTYGSIPLLLGQGAGFRVLTTALFCAGAFGGSINSSSGRAIMAWFADGERGLAMSIRQTAIPAGGSIGTFVIPWMTERSGGFEDAFVLLSFLCLLSAASVYLFVRDPVLSRPKQKKWQGIGHPFMDRSLRSVVLSAGLLTAPQVAVLTLGGLFLDSLAKGGLLVMSFSLVIVQVLGSVLRIVLGRITDKGGNRVRWIKAIARLCCLLCIPMAVVPDSVPLKRLLLIGIGVAGSSWHGIAFAEAAIRAGEQRAGTALGMMGTAIFFSSFLTPVLLSSLLHLSGWPAVWWVLSALLLVPAFLLSLGGEKF